MTDTDQMVTWLRAAMDAAQHDAEAATPGPWEPEEGDPTDDEVYTVHDGEHGDLVGNVVAYTRGGWGKDPGTQVTNMRHIARHNPAAVLRRIAADRKILDEHASDGDPQYPQCVRCADTHPDDCECGWHSLGGDHWRTAQTHPCATVRALAEGYGWTEEKSHA